MNFRHLFAITTVVTFSAISTLSLGDTLSSSTIMQKSKASVESGDGWVFYSYFTDKTYGIEATLTGMAVIQPQKQIHPPHVHTEEEFLMITQGEGVWTVNGKDSAAQNGDMLYAAPGEPHGIRNTGTEPLIFVVMKWQSKGVPVPK